MNKEKITRILLRFLMMSWVFCVCSACVSKPPAPLSEASLSAVVTSDLHLSTDPDVNAAIVPAMPYGKQTLEVIAAQTIDLKPDVLIITGDLTNSGIKKDMEALKKILEPVKDAGIRVVLTTGNHDFNNCTPEAFWDCYSSLLDVMETDSDSLSYITEIGNVRLFAMDDNSFDGGLSGTFSQKTMKWLESALKRAEKEGKTVLFLSHHSVIRKPAGDQSSSFQITNPDLVHLLETHQVHLCLSGHLHAQAIQHTGSLYEIISTMPLNNPHVIGTLKLHHQSLEYHTVPIGFEAYSGSALAEAIRAADQIERESTMEIFASLLESEGLSGVRYEGVNRLLVRFFEAYAAGTLETAGEAIKADPYYPDLIEALNDHNYGPWIEAVLSDPPENGNELNVSW